jgi:hypothetical protein
VSKFVASIPNPQLTNSNTGTYATNQGLVKDSLGNLYYVTMAQLGQVDPVTQPSLMIYKSTDSGHTWTIIVSDSNRGTDGGFGVSIVADVLFLCIVNSIIAPNSHLGMYQYNTTTNTFAADDYGGPAPNNALNGFLAQTSLSDGTIGMAYVSQVAGVTFNKPQYVTWKAGVWSAPINLADGTNQLLPQWIVKEVATDRVHVFLYEGSPTAVTDSGIWHISAETDGTLHTLQNPIVATPNINNICGPIGAPCIFGADTQIELPYVFGAVGNFTPGVSSLRVLRGTVAANPVWTDEQAVPANFLANNDLEPFLGLGYFIVSAVNVSGGITIFFGVDNNEIRGIGNNIQSFLYTVSTTATVAGWGTPALLFTAPFPSAFSSPYALPTSASASGVVIGTIAVTGDTPQYGDLRLFFIGSDAERVKTCLGES